MAYRTVLPRPLANLHDAFHVSHMRRYILDPSYVIQVDNIQVRENLVVEASLMQIEDWEVKQLCGKEIPSLKVECGELVGGSITWELQSQMRESYPTLFSSGNF